jgi:3-dehydroquinate dehydratase/shikimate dehydrogenase
VTLIAVAIPVVREDAVGRALEHAHNAKSLGADLVEWRIDAVATTPGGVRAALRLVAESPLPCIVTIRDECEGGSFDGTEEDRLRVWRALASAASPPAYLDLEHSAVRDGRETREFAAERHQAAAHGHSPRLLLSFHDFRGRPPGLSGRVAELWADPSAAIAKVAWTAPTERDNLEAFEFMQARAKPTIALCMGEHGLMSRVLAPKFGGFLTYARLDEHGTAPGQPSLHELLDDWSFRSIDASTRVYGVIGHPVSHSRSPAIHNAWFRAAKVNARLFPISVAPMWEAFKATLGEFLACKGLDFSGAAVTAPHKLHALRYLQEVGGAIDDSARRVGAVNTIVQKASGALRGMNTDVLALEELLPNALAAGKWGRDAKGARALVLGAGGAARAAVAALVACGAEVTILNRTPRHAKAIADGYKREPVHAHGSATIGAERFDLIANCTTVGMTGGSAPEGDPLPEQIALDEGVLVFDAIYAPEETPLLRRARSRGARTLGGEAMFMTQASLQFKAWTGKESRCGKSPPGKSPPGC